MEPYNGSATRTLVNYFGHVSACSDVACSLIPLKLGDSEVAILNALSC